MPYPESCPECGGTFRNTGTHFTARRNEVGRHVLLELGCQNSSRRFWWNFSTGKLHETVASATAVASPAVANLSTNGHGAVATLERPGTEANGAVDARQQVVPLTTAAKPATDSETAQSTDRAAAERSAPPASSPPRAAEMHSGPDRLVELQASTPRLETPSAPRASAAADESGGTPATGSPETAATPQGMGALKEAFVRQLQLDRLTMRQMRSLLMAEDARRAIEVAAGATEGTYERLALILFGVDLGQLLGKQAPVPANTGITAEERLELQREKARIRARLRRAAIKAAKLNPSA